MFDVYSCCYHLFKMFKIPRRRVFHFCFVTPSRPQLLLFGVLILSLVWVYKFHGGFAWNEDVDKQFNVHPVLMITGFIFFMGRGEDIRKKLTSILEYGTGWFCVSVCLSVRPLYVDKQFNVHPVLMIIGFIFFMGRGEDNL